MKKLSDQRELSKEFMNHLIKQEGVLNPILTRVKADQTLMLAIRKGFINIYYRGGNILRITEKDRGLYQTFFDNQYGKSGQIIPNSPDPISNQGDAEKWVASFPERKSIMDVYFSAFGKAEREFQQLVARENNYSSISNETEYFIPDLEVTDSLGRFDMVAIRWLANDRKNGNKCNAALIEMKYGDGALGGRAGLIKHLKDIDAFISDKERYRNLLLTTDSQFNQLDQLGLIKYNKGTSNAKVKLSEKDRPEVIFIIANHNPRSTKLKTILSDPEIGAYERSDLFDLKFYVASFAGYGLHSDCMFDLSELRGLLRFWKN